MLQLPKERSCSALERPVFGVGAARAAGMRSMRIRAVAVFAVALAAGSAQSGLLPTAIDGAGVALTPDARVPTGVQVIDETGRSQTLADAMAGRPSVLILTDYTCHTLCGPVLALTAAALDRSGLTPSRDYRLLAIGLDPKDQPQDALAMKQAEIGAGGALVEASSLLIADSTALGQVTASLGYRAVYDPANDQFAHPVAVFVLTSEGRVARALTGLGLTPSDLR